MKEPSQMADLRCNVCFRQPSRETPRFAITNCGHVVCDLCLQKGKKEECGVCRSYCRTIFLNDETHPDIKMLFMDVSALCNKYSKEFTAVADFQDSHRRRLSAHCKGKIAKLEETIKELTQELQNLRASQSYNRLPGSGDLRNLGPITHPEKPNGMSPFSVSISRAPNSKTFESMDFAPSAPKKNFTIAGPTRLSMISPRRDAHLAAHPEKQNGTSPFSVSVSRAPNAKTVESMDFTPPPSAPKKKNFTMAGPTRMSMISPPQDGRMGQVPYRSSITGSLRSSVCSSQPNVHSQLSQPISQSDRTSVFDLSSPRSSQIFQRTPVFTPSQGARQPITIANILQRRH
ncbi:probable E3 SUMO-protein ligase RNF212 isoform X1 [Pseudophryne corroboree]|uniref:probable E3 SUMO-protein ligase RNF212 isoform X1 n=1 Tax=Pseudophryne corroboree TaxID=495146 RepID=UPI0030814263